MGVALAAHHPQQAGRSLTKESGPGPHELPLEGDVGLKVGLGLPLSGVPRDLAGGQGLQGGREICFKPSILPSAFLNK